MKPTFLTDHVAEALDNVSASLETMLIHFGHLTPPGDNAARNRVLDEGRVQLARYRKMEEDYMAHISYSAENGLEPMDFFEFMADWEFNQEAQP